MIYIKPKVGVAVNELWVPIIFSIIHAEVSFFSSFDEVEVLGEENGYFIIKHRGLTGLCLKEFIAIKEEIPNG